MENQVQEMAPADSALREERDAAMQAAGLEVEGAAEGAAKQDACEHTLEDICAHLSLNRSNTLPMCACLKACRNLVSQRVVEEQLASEPVMRMSMQTPHTLLSILVDAGAIGAIPVYEDETTEEAPRAIDYQLHTTDLGLQALAMYEPCTRFAQMLEGEPEGYADAYRVVLDACREGATLPDIEQSLAGHPALHSPKTVFAGYFVSKLETVGGIVWDGAWRATVEGARMADSIPVCA